MSSVGKQGVHNKIPEPETYWWLSGRPKKLIFQNLTKNMMENWSTGNKTLENKSVVQKVKYNKNYDRGVENKSVVQKIKYNKNCDRVCAEVCAYCLIALIYLIYAYC